jgi:peptide/nickel transport system ATP-binding protein
MTLLQAVELTYTYRRGGVPAVEQATLDVADGDALGVVGESGSGKTTLGRLLVGALPPTRGSVRVDGRPWAAIGRNEPARRRVQMVFQDPYGSLNAWRTPIETVAEVLRNWNHLRRREAIGRAAMLLTEVGLSDDAMHRLPHRLSGGQCQRVGIARALAADPAVLIADEPTSALDVSVQAQILNLLRNLRETRGLALVLISHDLSVINYATERAVVMYGGRIVEQGPTQEVMTAPAHPYTQLLVDRAPEHDVPAEGAYTVPDASAACVFAAHCPHVHDTCVRARPRLRGARTHQAACVLIGEAS